VNDGGIGFDYRLSSLAAEVCFALARQPSVRDLKVERLASIGNFSGWEKTISHLGCFSSSTGDSGLVKSLIYQVSNL